MLPSLSAWSLSSALESPPSFPAVLVWTLQSFLQSVPCFPDTTPISTQAIRFDHLTHLPEDRIDLEFSNDLLTFNEVVVSALYLPLASSPVLWPLDWARLYSALLSTLPSSPGLSGSPVPSFWWAVLSAFIFSRVVRFLLVFLATQSPFFLLWWVLLSSLPLLLVGMVYQ